MDDLSRNTKSKYAEAEALIETSKELVNKVDLEVSKCKIGTSEAAKKFDKVKRTFKNTILKSADILLGKVGYEYITYEEAEAFELSIDGDSEEKFLVENLSSGRFTGLLLAMLVIFLTVAIWVYIAIRKLNIDPYSLTPKSAMLQVNPMLEWIGGLVGGTVNIGALILGLSALVMGWLVYALRVGLKGRKNLHLAQETFENTNAYCTTQKECQEEMQKIDTHLREATDEIRNLTTILNEHSATLKRVIHVEGIYEEEKEYHSSSKRVMRETEKIMRAAESLLETAITQEGKLNFESVQALNAAKDIYAEYLSRIYD